MKQFIDESMSDNISLSQYISRRGRKRPNFEAGNFILLVREKKNFMLSAVRYCPDYNSIQGTGKSKVLRRRDRGNKVTFNSSFFVI